MVPTEHEMSASTASPCSLLGDVRRSKWMQLREGMCRNAIISANSAPNAKAFRGALAEMSETS